MSICLHHHRLPAAVALVAGACVLVAPLFTSPERHELNAQERGKSWLDDALAMKTPAKAPASAPRGSFDMPACEGEAKAGAKSKRVERANPEARAAAQRGLNFLQDVTSKWQAQHNCYGCHVQAVTLEAFAVGTKHQYEVAPKSYNSVLAGLTTAPGGARGQHGLVYSHGNSLQAPSKAFGGAAFARHDQWIDQRMSDDLLKTAAELLAYQSASTGEINLGGWINLPVGAGSVQAAYQAIQTWQQSYARSADDRWLTAVQRSEKFLQATLKAWEKNPPTKLQDINYMTMGMLAAGVGTSEDSLVKLQAKMLAAQNPDGGWSFEVPVTAAATQNSSGATIDRAMPRSSSPSNAFMTGQTLYALRLLGLTDDHDAVARGTKWLIDKQLPTGGWSSAGFGKAEAMWGVLGLVSLDVLSVSIHGVKHGQRVHGTPQLGVEAWDNSGARVAKVELYVNDLLVYGACGDSLTYQWDASSLATGKHIVEARATNTKGAMSRQRVELFAGDVYLTQVGAEFSDNGTLLTLRNIAPSEMKANVRAEIFSTRQEKGVVVADKSLATLEEPSAQGAMSFFWNGKDAKGQAMKAGERYMARLSFVDADGKQRQSEEVQFIHDTREAQRDRYGEVAGGVNFAADQREAANAEIELVDEQGNVVQRTRSTANGQYRFKGVETDKRYKVRVKKDGYEEKTSAPMKAAPASRGEAQHDFSL
jgi:squalene-hopene/tetraprenyl-beta-curcumene cyclase